MTTPRLAPDLDPAPEETPEPLRACHVEEIRAGIDRALQRIADRPPLITRQSKMRLLAIAVTTAAVLLALNVAGTANDLWPPRHAGQAARHQHLHPDPGRPAHRHAVAPPRPGPRPGEEVSLMTGFLALLAVLVALVPAGVIGCVAGNTLRRAANRHGQSTVSRPTTTDRF